VSEITIVCPHCYSEGIHTFNLTTMPAGAGGSDRVRCENCYNKFRVYYQDGKIEKVEKT
jgi:DNA-directed RNA polymerase subunit M/transcription elongation factor TFIIS